MNFALAIVFLWVGAALLFVAFHPLGDNVSVTGDGGPTAIFKTLRGKMTQQGSAYNAEA